MKVLETESNPEGVEIQTLYQNLIKDLTAKNEKLLSKHFDRDPFHNKKLIANKKMISHLGQLVATQKSLDDYITAHPERVPAEEE